MIAEIKTGPDIVKASFTPYLDYKPGDIVIFKTHAGLDIGEIVNITKEGKVGFLIVRRATEEDLKKYEEQKKKAEKIIDFIRQKIKEKDLPVKIADHHIKFDGTYIKIRYLSEKKLNLKHIARITAKQFKLRVELQQMGARDYAKLFTEYGVCGLPTCCSTFIKEFESIGVSLIKLQRLSCGIDKVTGVCGRLMCCLAFEKEFYEEIQDKFPMVGDEVETPAGKGIVSELDLFRKYVYVKFEGKGIEKFKLEDIKFKK